eukprot:CAMPEP_0170652724 /NCGR_PEP_ID=MMETSP0224-20130122/47046_1 /TAXON_ID=285029 /ORGANISM="Togula jolla, Strain CCCM 725" /LENGTH=109 /DNA_ID=CAMNT_0010984587 /DNA_START=464 /DNA_END=794 /DNA_ORIENTATION=+
MAPLETTDPLQGDHEQPRHPLLKAEADAEFSASASWPSGAELEAAGLAKLLPSARLELHVRLQPSKLEFGHQDFGHTAALCYVLLSLAACLLHGCTQSDHLVHPSKAKL